MPTQTQHPVEGAPLIRPSTTDHPLYESIVEACRTVFDPEIPVNIYDLGLIYTIEIGAENDRTVVLGRVIRPLHAVASDATVPQRHNVHVATGLQAPPIRK